MSVDEKILTALYKAGSEPVFASQLAAQTGISNVVLAERIESLTKLGYVIEKHPHAGCRLLEAPDALMVDDLKARLWAMRNGECGTGNAKLKTQDSGLRTYIGETIMVFQETSSTNDMVHRLAEEGHGEGLVVIAESQTAGRGRQGRKWISPGGRGLWFSVLLRPNLPLESSSRLTVMATVAVATALRRSTALPLRVKWPNDILCRGRKTAGILVEIRATHSFPPPLARDECQSWQGGDGGATTQDRPYPPPCQGDGGGRDRKIQNRISGHALNAEDGRIRHAALGIGIDVNLEKPDFPEELHASATSLKMEAKKSFHRPTLFVNILRELDQARPLLSDENFPGLIQRWADLDETLGRQVLVRPVHGGGRPIRGLAANMDEDGALLVRTDDGRTERVMAGDIHMETEMR